MLSVSASGEGTLSYQWFKNGQPISGAQQIFHMFTARSDADFGTYHVRVSNAAGFTESNPAIVEQVAVPKITSQPTAQEVLEGTPFGLTVTAIGSWPYIPATTGIGTATAASWPDIPAMTGRPTTCSIRMSPQAAVTLKLSLHARPWRRRS